MTIDEILKSSDEFRYMLLNRLQSDCHGFLDYGRSLWGGDPKNHIKTMVSLWDSLRDKPDWLPISELKNLAYRVARVSLLEARHDT